MKNITIKILTSFYEVKAFIKERASKRYKHNIKVVNQIEVDIRNELNSGYWRRDISDYMIKELTNPLNGKIHEIVYKHKKQLK